MYPVLFTIAGVDVPSAVVFLALAIAVGVYVGYREALRRGFAARDFHLYWISVIPVALGLAGLNNAIFGFYLSYVIAHPEALFTSGLASFGAVTGMLGWGFLLAKIRRMPAAPTLDLISLMLPLMLGIYRIGCILTGCCYGVETDGPAGIYLPNADGAWAARYPTQALMMVFDFALFIFFWRRREQPTLAGKTTVIFLTSFSAFRLLLDGLRDQQAVYGILSFHQLTSLAILLITLYFVFEFRLDQQAKAAQA